MLRLKRMRPQGSSRRRKARSSSFSARPAQPLMKALGIGGSALQLLGRFGIRHCERSEAIQGNVGRPRSLDCFVAALLAMTIPSERSAVYRTGALRLLSDEALPALAFEASAHGR